MEISERYSDGPFKFCGLPGLILKISDTANQIRFECISIEKPEWTSAIYFTTHREVIKTDREKYLKTKQRFMDNQGEFTANHPLIENAPALPVQNYVKKPYNPIELQ
ncbi:MAG: GLPGLI family protein [Dysgonamonadaceae bacterium]|jgi:hypothetical protein|nr:GLPGLI family protein [Dysgonamonadaceae bacterium]